MMNNFLNVLLETTIYSTVLFFGILLFRKATARKASPVLQSVLWLLLVIKLCIPVALEANVHFFTLPAQQQESAVQATAPEEVTLPELQTTTGGGSGAKANAYQQIAPQPETRRQSSSSTAKPVPAMQFTWQQVAILVWIGGIACYLAVLAAGTVRMKKQLRQNSFTSPKLNAILEECKTQLGMRGNIPVYIMQTIDSPALTLSIFPKILIPADMAANTRHRELYFALYHELMHYKRKDYIVAMALHVLQAVYWFHPAVWAAFRYMRMDMETACDALVVKNMNADTKEQYAMALINLSEKGGMRLQLGMASISGKESVEQRIRGIYSAGKSRASIKITAVLLAAVLGVCCFTTACQPTPEVPVVVQKKDQEKMLEQAEMGSTEEGKAAEEAAPAQTVAEMTGAPDRFEYDFEGKSGIVHVNVDADVVLPEPDAIPIARVKGVDFTQEQVDVLRTALCKNEMFEQDEALSKQEIEDRISGIEYWTHENEIHLENVQAGNYEIPAEEIDAMVERIQNEIDSMAQEKKALQELYESAPADKKRTPTDGKLKVLSQEDYVTGDSTKSLYQYTGLQLLDANTDIYGNGGVNFSVINNPMIDKPLRLVDMGGEPSVVPIERSARVGYNDWTQEYFVDMDIAGRPELIVTKDDPIPEEARELLTLTPAQAYELVDGILQQADENLKISSVAIVSNAFHKEDGQADYYNYRVLCERQLRDVPVISNEFNSTTVGSYEDDSVQSVWVYETIEFMLDNNVIYNMSWHSPLEITEIVSESAALLPFDQIKDIFDKQVELRHAPDVYSSASRVDIDISAIRLTLMRIAEQNSHDTGLLVPVWSFVGHKRETFEYDGEIEPEYNDFDGTLFAINAIDGSVIDVGLGY